jgi:hypothetical protein
MPFGGFSSSLHAKPTWQLLVEFQFLVDWLPYSQDLNLLDFLCLMSFAQGMTDTYW